MLLRIKSQLKLQESDYAGFKFLSETENWYLVSKLKY